MNQDSVSGLLLEELSLGAVSGTNDAPAAPRPSVREMRAPKGYKIEIVVPGALISRVVRNDIQRTVGVYTEGSMEPHVRYSKFS